MKDRGEADQRHPRSPVGMEEDCVCGCARRVDLGLQGRDVRRSPASRRHPGSRCACRRCCARRSLVIRSLRMRGYFRVGFSPHAHWLSHQGIQAKFAEADKMERGVVPGTFCRAAVGARDFQR